MDKRPALNPTGSLQVNGPLSPPLTPALNDHGDDNAMGIMGATNPFHHARPVSPDPSVTSHSSRPGSSASSPSQQPTSTFTDTASTSFADSLHQPPHGTSSLRRRHASSAPGPLPIYVVDDYDEPSDLRHPSPSPSSPPPYHRPSSAASHRSSKSSASHLLEEESRDQPFPRLSRPVELLRSAYDVVVIGSGYGGGVAASRMARTGESVCVLERGREKWPGEYPAGTVDAVKELHCSGVLAPGPFKGVGVEGGDPTGLFHLVMGRGQSAVVANGESEFFNFGSKLRRGRGKGDIMI